MTKTEIFKISSVNFRKEIIEKVIRTFKKGGSVIFPTETVYGIGTTINNKETINKIYQLRKRPKNKALLILIGRKKDLNKYAYLTPTARKIINKFWPGPLTIILKKKKIVPNFVTANKKTVALRMPENNFLIKLIRRIKKPIIAPSANLSGQKPPVTATETLKDFFGKVDLILDVGKTKYKKESTILDLSGKKPKILRRGAISEKKLMRIFSGIGLRGNR